MNRVVGIVVAISLVMHFTLGCCAQPCHFSGAGNSRLAQASETSASKCCHRGHGHRHQTRSERPSTEANAQVGKVVSIPCHHDCGHCSCVAIQSEKVQLPVESQVHELFLLRDSVRIGFVATARPTGQVSLVLPGQHLYSLCERFLI